ncbi:MAG: AraC family transcriptional regulator [Novosphingobium sp.]
MSWPDRRRLRTSLIDFSLPASSKHFELRKTLSHGGVHAFHGFLEPHEDGLIGGSQLSVVVHESEPFTLEWTQPGSDRLTERRVEPDMLHINPGDRPFRQRWTNRPLLTGIALDRSLVDRIGEDSFGRTSDSIQTAVGVTDERLLGGMRAVRDELASGAASEDTFAEHVGMAMAILLFRHYSDGPNKQPILRGGLGQYRLNKVFDYIEAEMENGLSVAALATVADLSLQHFSAAFLNSTGMRPHRFILNRRIERGKVLLLTTDMSIAEISFAVGFASQSHFAERFREAAGVTPLRFRLERMQ